MIGELRRGDVISESFSSSVPVALDPVRGIVTFPEGTSINYDLSGTGDIVGIKAVVTYQFV